MTRASRIALFLLSVRFAGGAYDAYAARTAAPLAFEENRGQLDPEYRFLVSGAMESAVLTAKGMVLHFAEPMIVQAGGLESLVHESRRVDTIALDFVCSRAGIEPRGRDAQATAVNVVDGRDPSRSRNGIPLWGVVEYPEIYAGIDAVVYSSARQLEFDLVVAPGARIETVRLGVRGASVELDANGNAVLSFGASGQQRLVLGAPRTHQTVGREQREVASRFTLPGSGVLGIEVGSYDPGLTLVVDPVVLRTFSDAGNSIAVDSLDEVYIAGVQDRLGNLDVVVTTKAFRTVFRGGGDDIPSGIAIDPSGNVYVAGRTDSVDFPTTPGSFQATYGGGREDAWVAKLDARGNVLYATHLGGAGIDRGYDLAVNAAGEVYIVGITDSIDYPLARPFQTYQGRSDGFVTRLDPTGASLVYSTCFGGPSSQGFYGVAIDSAGHIYAAGACDHGVMPIKNAFQPTVGGGGDGFLVEFEPDGSDIVFSTYLGGGRYNEAITAVALDQRGSIYVTGFTDSHDFPVRNAFQPTFGDAFIGRDAFVAKFLPEGADLVYSTYLGGSSGFFEMGIDIAVDGNGRAFVLGEASAVTSFPLWDPLQPVFGGGHFDGFIAAFEDDGAVVYSSFWGGPGDDVWHQSVEGGVALDSCGTPYYILPLRAAQQIGDARVIACPPDLTLACPWNTDPSATGEPLVVSGFCPAPSCTYDDARSLRACGFTTGVLARTWTCTDGRDTETCVQRMELSDTTPPVVTAGSVLDCYPDAAAAAADAIAATAAVDDCGHPVTFDAGVVGTCAATVTVRAKDTCGNAGSVDYATTIDGTPPMLAGVPADTTVECDAVPPPAIVTATDDCDSSPALTSLERRIDGSCVDRYALEREWTATDRCGNVARAVQVLTVVDTVPPTLLGVPPDETAECDAVPPPTSPAATDGCDPAPGLRFAERKLDGDCADRYTLEREWTATDRCGNEAVASQIVTIVDTTPPGPQGALVPIVPRAARAPDPPSSVCSPPTSRLVRIECEPLVDNCDPTPVLSAKLLATHHDVPAKGVCVRRIDAIEVHCGEVLEIRLVAPSCPLKPPKSPRPSLSVTSAGLKIISGESVILHVEGIDRCGNAAVFDWDPAKEPSPLCDEVLIDGTCCPAIAAPPSPKCGVPPCGTATLLLGDPTGESRASVGHEGPWSLTGRYDRGKLGLG